MLSQLLMLMPRHLLERSPQWALIGAAVGILLWAAGAAFSRYLTTLVAVAIGTSIGMRLPSWIGWEIDGMGTGVAGALILGLSGYLLHRTWVGVWLAGILVAWSGIGVWMAMGNGANLPVPQWHGTLSQSLAMFWKSLPSTLNPSLPLAGFAAIAASVVASLFFPKFSKCLTYSLLGTTLIVASGLIEMQEICPGWVAAMEPRVPIQLAALIAIVLLGIGIQWYLLPESPVVNRESMADPVDQNQSDDATRPSNAGQLLHA